MLEHVSADISGAQWKCILILTPILDRRKCQGALCLKRDAFRIDDLELGRPSALRQVPIYCRVDRWGASRSFECAFFEGETFSTIEMCSYGYTAAPAYAKYLSLFERCKSSIMNLACKAHSLFEKCMCAGKFLVTWNQTDLWTVSS